jgi:hypothetical protein
MNRLAATPFHLPDETVLDFYPPDRLQNPALHAAAAYWQELRGARPYPTRDELNPSAFAPALRHMALVRVLAGDFEFRIIGDSLAGAFSVPLRNRRLGEIATAAPSSVTVIAGVYRRSVETGQPLALSGTTGRNAETAMFTHFEALVLPLGRDTVEHLLTFMICKPPSPAPLATARGPNAIA